MENIDWLQFETLAIIFVGIYILFELLRFSVMQCIRVYCGTETEKKLYNTSVLFSILRICLISCILIAFVFTAVFNRHIITKPHSDVGHKKNVENLTTTDTAQLQAKIAANQARFKEKSIEEVNSDSQKNYQEFLNQNGSSTTTGEQQ